MTAKCTVHGFDHIDVKIAILMGNNVTISQPCNTVSFGVHICHSPNLFEYYNNQLVT